jgi:hypothetical protein
LLFVDNRRSHRFGLGAGDDVRRQCDHGGDKMKIKALCLAGAAVAMLATPAFADGFKNCTKAAKASWKPASEAEAAARTAGYEVRRSKIEGSCYEVYGVKGGKLYELFYSPEDLSLKHTKAK